MAFSDALQDGHPASIVLPQRHYQLGDLRVLLSRTVDILSSECQASSSGGLLLRITMSAILRNTLVLAHISLSPSSNRQRRPVNLLLGGRAKPHVEEPL